MFDNLPHEMRAYKQWLTWRLENRDGFDKPTKIPYVARPQSGKASPTNPADWETFDNAVAATEHGGFSGIGFVLTHEDPFLIIDLDDTQGDRVAWEQQLKIYSVFNSYSEYSPSGKGIHIIIKANIPKGRRRSYVELYSAERYMTMTGNIANNQPVREAHEILSNGLTVQQTIDIMFEEMGGKALERTYGEDQAERQTDDEILQTANGAVNGDKFSKLWAGDWQPLYQSQSEADFALIDILAFYTQNKQQIARLFRASELGKRDKAQREDYLGYMITKSFDRQIPPIDIDGLKLRWEASGATAGEPGSSLSVAPNGIAASPALEHVLPDPVNAFPPGLLGEIAQFILDAAPRPVPEIALAGAIALLSAITGRAYNTYTGAGLNQYVLLLAPTGTGKDAISDGISKIFAAVQANVPAASDFGGPGELVSSAGLIKWMERKPCCLSILGEIGLLMQQMAHPNANAHIKGLQRTLTQMYSKSGQGKRFDPSAYSDKEKNTGYILSPSLTIIGESVPSEFYNALDEGLISNGLLPRFTIFEYEGERPYLQEGKEFLAPNFDLVQSVSDIMAHCLGLAHHNKVHFVPCTPDALDKFREFERWTTDQINTTEHNETVLRHLWNRAHLKALKLASVYAVGINFMNPVIDMVAVMWATNLIVKQTFKLVRKFEMNEVGTAQNSEAVQVQEVIKIIAKYIDSPFGQYEKFGGSPEMHKHGVITQSHIQRRSVSLACMRHDRIGATNAIKRALTHLLEGDEMREMNANQMQTSFGTKAKAFVIINPHRFKEALERITN